MVRYFLVLSSFFALYSPLHSSSNVFFSPDDKVTSHLIHAINNAKTKIYGAIYLITDKKIANALIDAKNNRQLDVQIVTDQSNLESDYGKAQYLKQNGIDIFVFKPMSGKKQKYPPLMHNKFAIIDNKVWTGSFNWTVSANKKNLENVTVIDEKAVRDKYLDQFEKLKRKCVYQPSITKKMVRRRKPWYKKAVKNVDHFLTMVKRKIGHSKKS